MMKLFYSPGACSMAPHILLNELGAQYETYKVDLRTKKLENGDDFLAINPKGQVPTLVTEDGQVLTENAVILQYLADTYAYKHELPAAGTWERYKANEWLNFVATEVHKSIGSLFSVDRLYTDKAVADVVKTTTKTMAAKKLEFADKHLAKTPFLMGNEFSAPDAYLFTILGWHKIVNIDITPYPALGAYMQRMSSRPAVQKTMKTEGLIQ